MTGEPFHNDPGSLQSDWGVNLYRYTVYHLWSSMVMSIVAYDIT